MGLDTDVVVHWLMGGAPHYQAVARFIASHLDSERNRVAILPQVLHEFLHVVTDVRRFASPLPMDVAIAMTRTMWDAREVVRVLPNQASLARTLDLLDLHKLGRKRILDTALAATLEGAGIRRLITLNVRDFRIFSFLDPYDPSQP